MAQQTILITGASDGIGAASARTLAAKGHRVLIVGRSAEKTAAVARETGAEPFVADFSRLDEVRALAGTVKERLGGRLDVLANNAGGIFGDRTVTADGYEYTLQVNHLAPFLLTHLLLDELCAAGGTVVNTSSIASRLFGNLDLDDLGNERGYSPAKAYGDAKLDNILFTRGLHARVPRPGRQHDGVPPRQRRNELRRGHHQPDAVPLPHAAAPPGAHQRRQGWREPHLGDRGTPRRRLGLGQLLRPAHARDQGQPAA